MKAEKLKPDYFIRADGSVRIEFDLPPSDELAEILQGPVDVEIKKHREKRSLSANAYAWVLIDALADALRRPRTEVYREAVKDIGGVSEYVCIQNEAVPKMRKIWEGNGTGWQVEELDSKLKGCTTLRLVYGSSEYDTKQMSELIDHLIQDCEAVGIDHRTPAEIAEMLKVWEEAEHDRNR